MNFRIAFAPARPAARTLAGVAATAALAFLGGADLHGATPPPAAPAPAKKAHPKQPAKQPAPAPQAAPQLPTQPGQPPAAAGQPQQIPLVYSAWIKLCGKNPGDPSAKEL